MPATLRVRSLMLAAVVALVAVPALATAPAPDAADLCGEVAAGPQSLASENATPEIALFTPVAQAVDDCRGGSGGRCLCPKIYAPVCGCDGNTYANDCLAACKIKSWTSGACDGSGI
ncbi:MAG TPA: Kazal-type serine protease inhibitor domain-containing protein [Thermoanaerobaculia bacterium]|nr:Kazal-type serine protease inhibitor domain-containing protein [Thermoanaerobaculia bacterium]